jgi:polyribonucleotide nucleotidyltransferase
MLGAMDFAFEQIQILIQLQEELVKIIAPVKVEVPLHVLSEDILNTVRERFGAMLREGLQDPDKASREAGIGLLIDEVVAQLSETFPDNVADIREAGDKVVKEQLRDLILTEGKRPDGRGITEIRPISVEAGLLPRVHGSGLFTRGQTQVLTTLTLGSADEAQTLDTLEEDGQKHYMHFYNFPPYSVGECRPLRGPGRREIGHGALAERALRPVVPPVEEFPYTMLLTSETPLR